MSWYAWLLKYPTEWPVVSRSLFHGSDDEELTAFAGELDDLEMEECVHFN